MTTPDPPADDAIELERARSAATLAVLHDELDAARAAIETLRAEIETLRAARVADGARVEAAERELAALRDTRAVRWATRVRGLLG